MPDDPMRNLPRSAPKGDEPREREKPLIEPPADEPADPPQEKPAAGGPAPQQPRPAAPKSPGTGPMTSASLTAKAPPAPSPTDAPGPARPGGHSGYGAVPSARRVEAIRKARFGDGPGVVRVDAAPDNQGDDPRPAVLVFVDGSGKEVGREDFNPDAES